MTRFNLLRAALLAPALLAGPARAQELLHTLDAPNPGSFGAAVSGVPDTNGDGRGDLLVGSPNENAGDYEYNGRARLYSGQTGALLRTLQSPNPEDYPAGDFGGAVSGVADVDGDGGGDLLVGAPNEGDDGNSSEYDDPGRVYLFSGRTGLLIRTLQSPNSPSVGNFGYAVSGVADVDGDGRGDLLIGARYESSDASPSYAGRAYVYSGATGQLLFELRSPSEEEDGYFGRAVSGVADADGDGIDDLLVGAGEGGGAVDAGRAYLFSGATGDLLRVFQSPNPEEGGGFGEAVSGVPDVDGDGRGDLLVGASGESTERVYLFSGASGAQLRTLASPNPEPGYGGWFGSSVSGVPDVDGDGRGELLVGAGYEDPAASPDYAGRAYLYSGTTGAFLFEFRSPNEEFGGNFGLSVSGVLDADGDGRGDLLVGTKGENRAYLFSGGAPAFTVLPSFLDFGEIVVGSTSAGEAVTITAIGRPTTVTALTFGGADPGEFVIASAPAVPFTLQLGESATVEIVYAPTRPELVEATLVVGTDVGSESVALRGIGLGAIVVTAADDADDGACDTHCSLREAIAAANSDPDFDNVSFAPSLAGQTITLTRGELTVTRSVRTDGGSLGLTVSGNGSSRVFTIESGAHVELVSLTITGGRASYGGGILCEHGVLVTDNVTIRGNVSTDEGGGVTFDYDGSGTIRRSTISGNTAEKGGGLYAATEGTITVEHSTISGNVASERGGGIYNSELDLDGSFMWLRNVTVVGNEAGIAGGGLFNSFDWARVHFKNSVLAGNTVGGDAGAPTADCRFIGSSTSYGYNVLGAGTGCISDGPGDVTVAPDEVFTRVLNPALANNGGPTRTHALRYQADNPALDLGGACGPTDQRGLLAPVDGPDADLDAECDAGSVEAAAPILTAALTPESAPVVVPAEGGAFQLTAAVTNVSDQPQTFEAWSEARLPGGGTAGPLLGPVTVRLGPGQSATRALVQQVPAEAPAGRYVYVGYVGRYPDGALAGDGFVVTKEASPGRESVREVTQGRSGELAGWAALYAGSGAPVAAGDVWGSDDAALVAGADAEGALPTAFALHGARPNPFTARTTFGYDLPRPSRVRLVVYDVLGREVARLVEGERAAGRHEAVLDGAGLPGGTYLVRLVAGSFVQSERLTLVR